jgi:hypothetical protein
MGFNRRKMEDQRRPGGARARESDPGSQRLAAPQSTEPPVWLLLP